MTAQPQAIVVGAGIIGAAIAWHLAAGGARVTVVDAEGAGGIATPRSFAWINASWGNPEPYFRLRHRAMAEWRRLAAEVPAIPLSRRGGLRWDLGADDMATCVARHGAWGYEIRAVGRDEAARLEPKLREPPERALHAAEEGAAEPRAAAEALLADAERRGAQLRRDTQVETLVRQGDAVVGIETAEGPVGADVVVLAAGIATPALAATAGVGLPLTTPPGLLVHSAPHPPLLNGIVLAPELHMRQTAEGRIVAATDFAGMDPGTNAEAEARAVMAHARAMLRHADDLALDFHTVGHRPVPADGFPVIGRPAGLDGLYLAVMHSGMTLAPAVGLFAAAELLSARRDPLLAPYGPDRLAEGAG